MTRQWIRRDRQAEATAIGTAITQLLESMTADSEPPTVTDLAAASNLRRDYLYDHKELISQFKQAVQVRTGKSGRFLALEADLKRKKDQVRELRDQCAFKDEQIRVLRLTLAETTLELDTLRASANPQGGATQAGRRGALAAVRHTD